jgi:hypothetical protein
VLSLWIRQPIVVARICIYFPFLVVGMALHIVTHLTYVMHVAFGRMREAFITHFVAILVLVPATFVLVQQYGAVGGPASMAWVLFGARNG